MTIFNPGSGFTGDPDPGLWATNQAAIANMRAAAAGASLMLWPEAGQMGAFVDPLWGDGVIYEQLSDLATTTRPSNAWHPNWDFVNGSVVGPLTEFGVDEPVLGPGGLLVANQVENLALNPRAELSGGEPVNWARANNGGTVTYLGRGTKDGWPYADYEIDGTVTFAGVVFSLASGIAAGDSLCGSIGVQFLGGSAGGSPISLSLYKGDNTGSIANQNIYPAPEHRRYFVSGVAAGTGATLRMVFPSSALDAYRMRLFAPSVTKTAYPTPIVLPPAGAPGASVKPVDQCSIPAANWYRHDSGSLIVELLVPPRQTSTDPTVGLAQLQSAAGFGDFWGLEIGCQSGRVRGYARAQSGGQAANEIPIDLAPGARAIAAVVRSGAGYKAAVNGTIGALFGAGIAPATAAELHLGYGAVAGPASNQRSQSTIQRVRFVPRALDDAELAAATTPYWS